MKHNESVVRTSCRGCHGVCQVLVHMNGARVVKVTGDPDSITSRGYICPKGRAAPEILYHPDRLAYPMKRVGKRGENRWKRLSWDEALSEIAEKFAAIKKESGAEFVAVAQGTGRPYTPWNQRFANSFGTPNFVSHSQNCFFPRIIASNLTMGRLPVCDLYGFGGKMPSCVMIWGCNITGTGAADGMCGATLQRALKQAKKVIVVDPRCIGPAKNADHWLRVRPGTDGALALAMINVIISENLVDHDFVDRYTTGFDGLALHVRDFTPEWAEQITRISADEIRAAAITFATSAPACVQWGNGIDTNLCSLHTARSISILMGITGNIDKPGSNIFLIPPDKIKPISILVNPEHTGFKFLSKEQKDKKIGIENFPFCKDSHPPTFWESVLTGKPYRVRGMWIVGTNPILTGTQGLKIERALKEHIEFTVVSDLFMTPTAQMADLVLPVSSWLEQDDIQHFHMVWAVLARKKLAQVGEARSDRDITIDLAHRLGLHEAFPWKDGNDFLEWVLEDTGLNFEEFCEKGILTGEMKYNKFETQGFNTPSGKFEFASGAMSNMGLSPFPVYREPPFSPVSTPRLSEQFPLILMSGLKVQNYFHTELRQINSLRSKHPDPLVDIHPDTASGLGIGEGDWVWIETPGTKTKVTLRARLFDGIAPDVVHAQHAWWFPEEGPPDYGWKKSNVNLLFGDEHFDPESGAEPLKCYMCKVYKA